MKSVFWIFLLAIGISVQQSQFANAGLLSALIQGPGSQSLYNFDSANPGVGTSVAISGLLGADTLLGIDYRPLTGELYGLSSGSAVYTINTTTGNATQVGTGFAATPLSGATFGFDFNPTIDRIRVVSEVEQNLVVNPITGALQLTATPVLYNVGDVNFGANPNVVHHAYIPSSFGAPTATSPLFAIDTQLNALVLQSNNLGTLATVAPLTVGGTPLDVPNSGFGGFDIDAGSIAFASFHDGVSATSSLFTINLTTGAATNIGAIPGAVRGLSAVAVPEPSSFALLGVVIVGAAARRRRLKLRKQSC